MKQPVLLSIAGMIGVGKTTLARQLADIMCGDVLHEQYGENPFLAREVSGDREAALPSELFFLLSRAHQLDRRMVADKGLLISDYIFEKNRIFARINLTSHQFTIYDEVEQSVLKYIAKPKVIIYLRDSIENCLSRIARRGRGFEKNISYQYMKQLDDAYESLFGGAFRRISKGTSNGSSDVRGDYARETEPVVIKLNCGEYDFRQESSVRFVAERLSKLDVLSCDIPNGYKNSWQDQS